MSQEEQDKRPWVEPVNGRWVLGYMQCVCGSALYGAKDTRGVSWGWCRACGRTRNAADWKIELANGGISA
jgi:hypothetical protein